VVTGEPQLLEAEPGGAEEAALQPLHRVQAVGQAPEDPDTVQRGSFDGKELSQWVYAFTR